MFSRFSLRAALVTTLSLLAIGTASAQSNVQLEGTAAYSIRGTRHNASTSASVSRVSNYCYECTFQVQVVLSLSRTPYSSDRGVSGVTVARSNSFFLSPRTYVSNVRASGRSSFPAGRYFPILLAVDPVSKTIYSATGFTKTVSARTVAKNIPALRKLAIHARAGSLTDAPKYTEIAR